MAKLTKSKLTFWLIFLFKKIKKMPERDKRLTNRTAKSDNNKLFIITRL